MAKVSRWGKEFAARQMTAKYPGGCYRCGGKVTPGTQILVAKVPADPNPRISRTVTQIEHADHSLCAAVVKAAIVAARQDKRTTEQKANDYLDGDENALGGGSERG